MGWYPRRSRYYASVESSAEIEQGDILWGVPSLRATHPAVADRFVPTGGTFAAEELEPPALSDVLRGTRVDSQAVMVMPHTCDFYGLEKGRTHPDRLVACIHPLTAPVSRTRIYSVPARASATRSFCRRGRTRHIPGETLSSISGR